MQGIGLYGFPELDIPLHSLHPPCQFPDKLGGVGSSFENGVTVITRRRNRETRTDRLSTPEEFLSK